VAPGRREIVKGSIGEPIAVRSHQWDANLASLGFANPAVRGGLLIDFGVHDYDVLEWLSG